MYLPKSKYSKPKYTRGDLFILKNGDAYTGWYFETYDKKYFTGKQPSKNSKPIIAFRENTASGGSEIKFTNDIIKPTQAEHEQGYFYRYFIQDIRNKSIVEVKLEKYNKFSTKNYINSEKVKWDLTTPVDNVKKGNYIYFGSEAKNKETILELENNIPGIVNIVKSYSEFIK